MDSTVVLHIARRGLETALLISAPVLIVTLVVGVVTALFQAVTSIREMTLAVVPKLLAVGCTLILFGSWMLDLAIGFTTEMFHWVGVMGK